MTRLLTIPLLLLVASGCVRRQAQAADAYHYQRPPILSDGWATGSLDDEKIDRARIERMTEAIRQEPRWNVHAVLIEHDGRLAYEEYFAGEDQRWGRPLGLVTFDRETRHDLRSVTKSVVSALFGIASHERDGLSLDEPILRYFPEYEDLQTPERRRITLRHVLGMTAGLDWNERVPYSDPSNTEIVMTRSADPLHYTLSRPIVTEPGATWNYSGGLTQVLAAVIQRTTGTPLMEYAQSVLFGPLGIADAEWLGRLGGMPSAASGLRLRPRDLAKFGSLYLHQGQWNHRQIVPADWVEQSTRRRLTLPKQSVTGYGYQWWHSCFATSSGPVEARTAVGNGDGSSARADSPRVHHSGARSAAARPLSGRAVSVYFVAAGVVSGFPFSTI